MVGIFTTPVARTTFWFNTFYFTMNSMSITAGHHRLWSHKSYKASPFLKVIFAMFCAGSAQGSIFWWCRDHRIHHRYSDTDKDPYNAHEGFFYSHIGWILLKRDRRRMPYVDTADLQSDKIVMWQHRNYIPLVAIFAFILPVTVCGLLGDWRGGFFHAIFTRIAVVQHTTFFGNSLAHIIGTTTYDDDSSAKDSLFTSLFTLGEGYHSFHHEFPNDYRSGYRYYEYDPTKWFIKACYYLGLSYDLKTFPDNEIEKGYLENKTYQIQKLKEKINYGTPVNELQVYTQTEFDQQVSEYNKQWLIINDIIHDVETFADEHPGGKLLVLSGIGKDMTDAFTGGVYKHHKAAHNLLSQFRVGKLSK
ncbi:hypothetical protein BB561_003005 [Smittium simulii]|uniref:Cytochrome b5 heme-binding domain-containing protein n=1 Tax=Smittium simulii TaxID=133385 RepID=A0A2T9YN98_9FUNG|nr:hypothetical protein BB561_003005 [Smittium simulii]